MDTKVAASDAVGFAAGIFVTLLVGFFMPFSFRIGSRIWLWLF